MTDPIAAVLEELHRLKRAGVSALPVSNEAIEALRRTLHRDAVPLPEPAADVAPVKASPSVEGPRGAGSPAAPTPPAELAGNSGRAAAASFGELVAAVDRPAPVVSRGRGAAPAPAQAESKLPPPPVVELPAGTKRERWEWLRERVLECPVCRAHTHGGHKVVFGVGNIDADIFFCGEAPGGDEEIQGEPFVGAAGKLLTKMIVAMGLRREDVYIGNILNWRPEMEGRQSGRSVHQTGNRPPTEEEMRFGLPYLRAQVEVVQPKVIVALGTTAAQGLLGVGSFKSLSSIRGTWRDYNGTPLMVTYHPSYLLRYADARTKRAVWEDLLNVMERVGLPITDKQRGFFKE